MYSCCVKTLMHRDRLDVTAAMTLALVNNVIWSNQFHCGVHVRGLSH